MNRSILLALSAAALTGTADAAAAASFSLRLIGSITVPDAASFDGIPFGGISGMQINADGTYTALSDDRGDAGRPPRFYNLSLDYGLGGFKGVTINGQTVLRGADGAPLPTNRPTIDPEGIRSAPGGNFYISSEGNWSTIPAALYQPKLAEYTADGRLVREFATPAAYDYVDNATTGARNNQLFEALAVTPDGTVYVGNEGPLLQDGGYSTATDGSTVRVTAMDPATGTARAQYVYALPTIQRDGTAGVPGLVEMVALDDGSFITMERAFSAGRNYISLAYSTIGGATDVLGYPSLTGASFTPMTREVLLNLDDPWQGIDIDNMEAMTWGRTLENGHRSLVIAADNNFNPAAQDHLFIAFEVVPEPAAVPLPAAAPMLLGGVGLLAALRRRARR